MREGVPDTVSGSPSRFLEAPMGFCRDSVG